MELDPRLALQVRVSKMLGFGFACSIVSISGIGSLIAVVIGIRVRRIIKESSGAISGMRMAWWCIIVGTLSFLITFPLTVWIVYKAFNR
jgi:uncharacterized membrane protein YkgB